MDMDVLDRDLLRAFSTMSVQSFEQCCVRARELTPLVEVLAATLESLLANHCAPVAFHRGVMASDKLGGEHPF
jgi:hypothetical protein